MKAKTLLCALALVGLTSIPCQAASVETPGFLKYECWFPPLRDANLVGTDVTLLDLDPNYVANIPDLTSYTAGFSSRGVFPDDSHEEYGARMTGWITPTVTGDYNFYLACDDASQLLISTDGTEANLVNVAVATSWNTGFVDVSVGDLRTTQSPVPLVAGQKYAVKIILKEGTGGDYVQIAMQAASGTTLAASLKPLASTMLSSMADPAGASLAITQQPVATSTPENASVGHFDALVDVGFVVLENRHMGLGRVAVDNLIIGPSGIFVVERKQWSGQVMTTPDSVFVDGRQRVGATDDVVRVAAAIDETLDYELKPLGVSVRPALLFEFAANRQFEATAGKVLMGATRGLPKLIRGRAEPVLGPETIVRLAVAADRLLE